MSNSVMDVAKEVDDLQSQLDAKKGQLLSMLGASNGAAPAMVVPSKAPGKKRGRKPGSKSGKATRAKRVKADGTRTPPAHEAVESILKRHKSGLVLAAVTKELETMRQKGEFNSTAKSLTNIASVALQKLKTDKRAKRDNNTTCWLATG